MEGYRLPERSGGGKPPHLWGSGSPWNDPKRCQTYLSRVQTLSRSVHFLIPWRTVCHENLEIWRSIWAHYDQNPQSRPSLAMVPIKTSTNLVARVIRVNCGWASHTPFLIVRALRCVAVALNCDPLAHTPGAHYSSACLHALLACFALDPPPKACWQARRATRKKATSQRPVLFPYENCFFSKRASLILLLPISTINFKKLNFIKSTKKSQYYMIRFFFLHVKKSIKFAPLTTRYLSSVGRAMD